MGTGRREGAHALGPKLPLGATSDCLYADVAVADDDEFVGAQVGGAHGAAGVEFVGGDADFGTKARKTALPRPLMRRFLQASCVRAKGPD